MLNDPASIIYSQCLSIDSNNVVINKRSPHGLTLESHTFTGRCDIFHRFLLTRATYHALERYCS